jgi:phage terminase large subunit-like protein
MPRTRCPIRRYCDDVVEGRVVAGRLARLACERHLRDLADGRDRGLRFDPRAGQHAIDFFGHVQHSKGEWAGKPVELAPFQAFTIGCNFGWKRADGTRRFRLSYNEWARKNGKSTMAAGVGLYLAFFAGEPGAEVYTAATKRDQARIVHGEAVRMRNRSPGLRARIQAFRDNLSSTATSSKYEPLGADADTLDGLNISGAIIDELHAHKNREMLDVIETATGSRREPLIFIITTAGVAGVGVCQEMHDYGIKVLEGQVRDDATFVYIAALDAGDDWQDESVWGKANPNLGVSVKLDDLQRKAAKAKEMPSAQATFLQKHLNVWVQSQEVWLPDGVWMDPRNAAALGQDLGGAECYGGLDLANTLDMCASVLVFPRGGTELLTLERLDGSTKEDAEDAESAESKPRQQQLVIAESYEVTARFWVPEERAAERERTHKVNYRTWIRQELIEVTEGNCTDYDVIRRRLGEDGARHQVREIAFDPYNATQLANQLTMDGFSLIKFVQSVGNYSEPMMVLEKLVREGRIRHGGNPVLRWMIGNVVAVRNGLGQAMPSRKKSADKIDGACALLMALARAILRPAGASCGFEVW